MSNCHHRTATPCKKGLALQSGWTQLASVQSLYEFKLGYGRASSQSFYFSISLLRSNCLRKPEYKAHRESKRSCKGDIKWNKFHREIQESKRIITWLKITCIPVWHTTNSLIINRMRQLEYLALLWQAYTETVSFNALWLPLPYIKITTIALLKNLTWFLDF